jgi:heme/copper-type cytochrome/quinol oxidase subunit 1
MLLGASLIVAPSLFLRLKSMPSRYDDPETTFILCNRVSTVGYLMTLVSVLVFVALIADSLTRFFRQRRRSGID